MSKRFTIEKSSTPEMIFFLRYDKHVFRMQWASAEDEIGKDRTRR